MDHLQELWTVIKLGVIGMFGAGFVAWYRRKKIGRKEAIVYLIAGGAVAHFGAPLAIWYFEIPVEHTGSIGFFLGAGSGCIARWIWCFVEKGHLTELIKTRFGK